MSASTVSITANQGPTTRRRANLVANPNSVSDSLPQDDNYRGSRLGAGDTADAILKDARRPTPSQTQPKKSTSSSRKSAKPLWLTVVSVLVKNLALLVLLWGFVQMIRSVVLNSWSKPGGFDVISGDFEGRVYEVERFVKTTMKAMQLQVAAVDKKFEDKISTARKEIDEKIEKKGEEVELKFKAFDVRSDIFEKFMSEFSRKGMLTKEEFGEFFTEFMKSRKDQGNGVHSDISLDEIKDYAREIVEREIERHAADGLGMVDYALASGGGRVLSHSEPFDGRSSWLMSWKSSGTDSPDAEKMIKPSFGEPGQCFPLEGKSGFVEIKLRASILPEAVTLEHVAKSVAYDRSSAPKRCIVSGYLQGQNPIDVDASKPKTHLLAKFTYDLEKSNIQTFKVEPSASANLINVVRFEVASNHGSDTHTCIYRLRIHGHEPSVPDMES